jgi:hypothetical protein
MATICKADYYYGALLSALVNAGLNITPSGSKDFTWSFSFNDNEIEEITKIHQENTTEKEFIFAFICSQKQLRDYN